MRKLYSDKKIDQIIIYRARWSTIKTSDKKFTLNVVSVREISPCTLHFCKQRSAAAFDVSLSFLLAVGANSVCTVYEGHGAF